MSFLGAVGIRVLLLCAVFAGVMGAIGSDEVNVRAVSCVVIMVGMMLYTTIEFRSKR